MEKLETKSRNAEPREHIGWMTYLLAITVAGLLVFVAWFVWQKPDQLDRSAWQDVAFGIFCSLAAADIAFVVVGLLLSKVNHWNRWSTLIEAIRTACTGEKDGDVPLLGLFVKESERVRADVRQLVDKLAQGGSPTAILAHNELKSKWPLLLADADSVDLVVNAWHGLFRDEVGAFEKFLQRPVALRVYLQNENDENSICQEAHRFKAGRKSINELKAAAKHRVTQTKDELRKLFDKKSNEATIQVWHPRQVMWLNAMLIRRNGGSSHVLLSIYHYKKE